ncbi:sulfite exporter TauE/SafE family protein [Ferdinandcohnia quinoae]|uniref:Probable membrane transporter protein n=1 Tax=Fredinandcohnia quinoae TaxID=2918902 RepID=A0AAW5E816_9BACI|nr:sulfite exporter TauE/SafE family protein [Fredinandcohnia sp. SECRCQ15]
MHDFIIYIILGLGVGIMSGFFGIGGGFILTPILMLMGFTPVLAIAISLLYTVATSLSGVVAHFRLKNIKWETAIILGISGIIATQIAHPFVLLLGRYNIENTIIPLMYLGLIIYFSISILVSKGTNPHHTFTKNKSSYFKIILIGAFAGFVSTTLGVGGGFIIVPLLMSVLSFQPKYAVGTSLLSVFMIVIVGFTSYASSTTLDYGVSLSLIIGAIVGGQLGAKVTMGYEDSQVRHFLAGLYITTGISLSLKLFHLNFIGLLLLLLYCLFMLIHFIIFRQKTPSSIM